MAVGQQNRLNIREASPDPGKERLYTPARQASVDQQSTPAGFYIRRVARAAAR